MTATGATTASTTSWTTTGSPIGELTLVAGDGRLTGVYFPHHWYRPDPATFGRPAESGFGEVKRQLAEYFAGERQRFDLPLDARGDEFQRRVWELIGRIPSAVGDRALSSRRRQGRQADRLRGRARAQAVPPGPRGVRRGQGRQALLSALNHRPDAPKSALARHSGASA